jgi:hypothetical protein
MTTTTRCILTALSLLAAAQLARAQWLNYPTPGIPRHANGEPNLEAPAPRTADGHSDLSGIWSLDPKCPATGLRAGRGRLPGRPGPQLRRIAAWRIAYQPWAAELVKKRTADLGKDDPVAFCKPGGPLRILTFPPPRKILQLPGEVVILSERDVTFRQLFTDGRPLPEDPNPTWNGYSVGKWENGALVVETIGLRNESWLDRNGSPMTAAAKITERYRRVSSGHLQVEVTVDDPQAYMKP